MMDKKNQTGLSLAAAITKAASKQTYFTIRLFVDHNRIQDAYRAYGYFRWVDDILDAEAGSKPEKIAFIHRQKDLLEAFYRGETLEDLYNEERLLADLLHNDSGQNLLLQSYLRNMMAVMEFDAERRGRVVSNAELTEYSRMLATAITDALYYFIGHDEPAPRHEARFLAVTAAHVTHMLRDTQEDIEAGYFNIPGEYLQMHRISPLNVTSPAYRRWVCGRVKLARKYFKKGREYLAQDHNLRRRLACYAYTARFEWVLRAIEGDNYCLRSDYPERKSLRVGLWMGWSALASMIGLPRINAEASNRTVQPKRTIEP